MSNASIAALIGDRVYAMYVPEDSALPAVAYNMVTDHGFFSMDGKTNFYQPRFILNIVSQNVADLRTIQDLLESTFNGWEESFTEIVVTGAYVENGVDIDYATFIPARFLRMVDVVVTYRRT